MNPVWNMNMTEGQILQTSQMVIPQKKYLKIGETSNLLGIKPHVLRYWESEFTQIKPVKSRTGQRMYRRQDVEMLLQIQDLLYQQKFTIKGAKEALKIYRTRNAGNPKIDIQVESKKPEFVQQPPASVAAPPLPPPPPATFNLSAARRDLSEAKNTLQTLLARLEAEPFKS